MTIQGFDNTGWKAGMQVKVGNVKYHVWRIDFGLKRVQVPVNNEITTNMIWLHCMDFEVVKEPTALDLIAAERERHETVEGWTKGSDQRHINGELARAAAAYAIPYEYDSERRRLWPSNWDGQMWKPTPENRIKELVKAGSLIAAEIDRLHHLENTES